MAQFLNSLLGSCWWKAYGALLTCRSRASLPYFELNFFKQNVRQRSVAFPKIRGKLWKLRLYDYIQYTWYYNILVLYMLFCYILLVFCQLKYCTRFPRMHQQSWRGAGSCRYGHRFGIQSWGQMKVDLIHGSKDTEKMLRISKINIVIACCIFNF